MENVASNSQDSNKWGRLISCIPTLKSVAINKDSFKLGRSLSCDIIVTESNFSQNTLIGTISKEHFLIFKKPCSTYAYLQDLSKNGTYVNGTKVERGKSVCLRTGDKIAIGQRMNSVYTFQSLLQEELPDTLTPLTHLENTPTYTEVLPIWGRLLSCLLFLKSFDIHQDRFKVGRSEKCDVSISHTTLRQEYKDLFSKEHFIICKDSTSKVVYIKDMSKSGTYLNNRLIGKHNMNILQHDDKISIGPKLEIFIYKCMYEHDRNFLPPELKTSYEPSNILGKGGAGEVRLAYEKHTCKMVAIKKITKSRSTASQMCQLNHPTKIHSEINILRALKYPFIISMQHIVETPMDVYIVLDYMRGGELTNRILSNEPMTESNVKFLFYQMVLAVDYLHTKGITHRDLKPENVLLHSEDVETLLKVSDFGLSKVTEEDDMMKTICGTLSYIAPEILNRHIREYNRQVDVWSLGVILFYMLGKRLPFKSPDRAIMEKNIINGYYTFEDEKWEDISSDAKDLVREMLTVEPEERITVINILKHQWLSKDLNMKIRVNQLYHSHLENMEENITPFDNEPSAKRSRSSSDESSTSQ
ncbi:ovarian-specific serine/threonine-protein kinase Lok-like [Diabrotica virgifera virgifera]|uniref:Ovarian-specific serine/threonine-protein kinase Lok n=1 Tax=Diabrotica virgifera virgifera TaxID=50390 RepID=A0ABM5K8Z5_DIAVI|nr:ovarian-specific serine/threonine-protein kinase Lok-like [Diabrotica virgifera virgifera]